MRVALLWTAAAAAVASLLVAPTLGASRVPPAPPVPPKTMTVQGVVVALAGMERVHTVRLDGPSTLVVYAGSPRVGPPTACADHTEVRLVAQDASEVRVAAFRYASRARLPKGFTCISTRLLSLESTPIALAAPLGARRVVANDRQVVVHDPAAVLRAAYLPPGVGPGTVEFEPTSTVFTTTHAGPRTGQSVTVAQGHPRQVYPSAYRLRSTVVRGRRASFGEVFGGWCVWWTERPDLNVRVCAQGKPVPATRAELLRVAESLA